jgi:hypothetical protein
MLVALVAVTAEAEAEASVVRRRPQIERQVFA